MRSMIIAVLAALFVTTGVSKSSAVFFDVVLNYMECHTARNVDWPWPYICPDRAAARQPFAIMTRNGWRRENLIGTHHFNPDTGKLTTAGQLKVHWIMTQVPHNFRQVFVERSIDPEVTQKRIAQVQEYAGRVVMHDEVPNIGETHLVSEGRPASTVDAINVRFHESMPSPVLPESTGGTFD